MPIPSDPRPPRPPARSRGRLARRFVLGVAAATGMVVGPPRADGRPQSRAGATRPAWDDPTAPAEEQARRALEAAGTLDEQAQRSRTPGEARRLWQDAAQLLDQCLARNPKATTAPTLQFQAAVYLWARSRALLDGVELLGPGDAERIDVARGLDDAADRLRRLLPDAGPPTDPFAQNVRFRLAQALADRARLRPANDAARVAAEKEAQGLLDRSITALRLRPFARLLHAELANRLGQFGPAQVEIEEAEKLDPPPPRPATTEAKLVALAGRGLYPQATEAIDRATVGVEVKALWKLRLALARRAGVEVGRSHALLDAEAFDQATRLRAGKSPEARRGLMELARAIDDPGPNVLPDWWDLLAEGHLLLREPAEAARLAARGADRAPVTDPEQAAPLRFKAGACWFEAERYAEADAALTQVFDSPFAPRALRARAGMLRALGRGRALAARQPGSSKAAYAAALEAEVRTFPDEPTAGEARWLLGKIRLAAHQPDEAIGLWQKIDPGHPRWAEAQAAAADLALGEIEDRWINRDLAALKDRVEATRNQLRNALDRAPDGDVALSLGVRLARLELIPGVGQPAQADATLDRLLRGPASPEGHHQARLNRVVALAELNRFADAETLARNEAKDDHFAPLLPAVRLLDHLAASTEVDLTRKRAGTLIRTLLDRWSDPIDRAPNEARDEIRLRQARAMIFVGDVQGARRALARWGGPNRDVDDPTLLRDLGDTYLRIEAYALAVDVERLRSARLAAGSAAWFDARYSLALGLFRSNRGREARRIIEATMILHPDLGGGETKARFERLGQKIGAEAD